MISVSVDFSNVAAPETVATTGTPPSQTVTHTLRVRIASNLVGNALQHSPASGTVRVDVRDEGDRVLLETSNAGPPIPSEVLPHLFESGRRGPPGRGRKESSGLGLGLYIVQQIVLAHGGTISVRTSAEEGTTFTVSLPRRFHALGRTELPSPGGAVPLP